MTDSKKLGSKRRAFLEKQIIANALCWSVARVEAAEIDRINILQATLLAMRKAVMALAQQPTRVLVDGNHCPDLEVPVEAIVKGDLTEAAISAASILAKESRDRIMRELDEQYPGYGLCEHMGYPTKRHIMLWACMVPARSIGAVSPPFVVLYRRSDRRHFAGMDTHRNR